MEDGGVTFVKLGQVLSTRRDLLPAEFTGELSRLQDDAAGVPWPAVEQVLRSELGAEVSELFASFDREPIAAASIAQVHAATLMSGARVVVKVRRPDVSQTVDRDLDITGRLAALADPADRRYLTGLLHQVILVALAATSGVMAVLMLGLHGGPAITTTVTLYAFFGYCLLVIAAILALRVLVLVFRPDIR